MDKTLINTKHLTLYMSTYQMGLALTFVPDHHAIYLMIGIFELEIILLNN